MKSILATIAVAVMSVGLADPAAAFRFSPVKTRFMATGPSSETLNGVTLSCTGKFRMVVWQEKQGFLNGKEGRFGMPIEIKGATTELKLIEFDIAP